MTSRPLAALVFALFAFSCDNRQAIHDPDPTLSRMLEQRRGDPFGATSAFENGMVMRVPPDGTIPVDATDDEPPPPVTKELLATGRARFETFCAACHGIRGDGVSVVASKMLHRPAPSLHQERFRALSREQIYRIATDGYGLMPSYAPAIGTNDRWAVASYVKALQMSQGVRIAELPAGVRAELERKVAP